MATVCAGCGEIYRLSNPPRWASQPCSKDIRRSKKLGNNVKTRAVRSLQVHRSLLRGCRYELSFTHATAAAKGLHPGTRL
jgi:hypothetical protein